MIIHPWNGDFMSIWTPDGEFSSDAREVSGVVFIHIIITESDQIGIIWDENVVNRLREKSHTWRNRFKRGILRALEQSVNKKINPASQV